jgi:hypothetical protein
VGLVYGVLDCCVFCVVQGGDSGTGEYPLMAFDYLNWANDSSTFQSKYLKIPVQAANYFINHYKNTSADCRVIVWPAQVLEMWWCDWVNGTYPDCCRNDAPSLSPMDIVFHGV